jgi:phage terminase large subunit-like protein
VSSNLNLPLSQELKHLWPVADRIEAVRLKFSMQEKEDSQTEKVQGFIDPDPIAWIEKYFYVPELKGPIQLDQYQKKALREALSRDENGLFNFSIIVWGDIKKSLKSCIAAAVVLWSAFQVDAETGWGSFYIIANDLKQADSRVAYYLRRAISLNPELRAVCHVRTGSYKITLPNQTFIEAIPIDPSGEAGSNADGIIFSELWGAHGKSMMQMWAEMTLSPTKFGKSFRWIETYAGYRDTSELLWSLYEQAVMPELRLDEDVEMYANRPARLFALWNTQPRLSWQSEEYYAQERSALATMPEEFDRVHRNIWSEGGIEKFLPSIALWDACEEKLPTLDAHTPCVLGVDAGESNDTFATVVVSRHPQRQNALAVRYVRPYVPIAGQPLDFDSIEQDIRDLCKQYAVQELAYDPMLLGQMIRRLKQKPVTNYVPFPQGAARLEADKGLFDLITQRQVAHDGNADLKQHLANADRKLDVESRKLRIVKRSYSLKIDLAVALSMAAKRASEVLMFDVGTATPDGTEQASTWNL